MWFNHQSLVPEPGLRWRLVSDCMSFRHPQDLSTSRSITNIPWGFCCFRPSKIFDASRSLDIATPSQGCPYSMVHCVQFPWNWPENNRNSNKLEFRSMGSGWLSAWYFLTKINPRAKSIHSWDGSPQSLGHLWDDIYRCQRIWGKWLDTIAANRNHSVKVEWLSEWLVDYWRFIW